MKDGEDGSWIMVGEFDFVKYVIVFLEVFDEFEMLNMIVFVFGDVLYNELK